MSGAWGPGDRLPKESELAAELGLSRNSLREAVRALSQLRVLEVRQGDGTYVSSLEPDLLLESTGFISHLLLGETAIALYEVRRILEAAAAALAAARIDDEEKQDLGSSLDRMREAQGVEELLELLAGKPKKLAAVALANKMARIIWAMMVSGETYRRPKQA